MTYLFGSWKSKLKNYTCKGVKHVIRALGYKVENITKFSK